MVTDVFKDYGPLQTLLKEAALMKTWNEVKFIEVSVWSVKSSVMSNGNKRVELIIKPQEMFHKFICAAFDEVADKIEILNLQKGDIVNLTATMQFYKKTNGDETEWAQSFKIKSLTKGEEKVEEKTESAKETKKKEEKQQLDEIIMLMLK